MDEDDDDDDDTISYDTLHVHVVAVSSARHDAGTPEIPPTQS